MFEEFQVLQTSDVVSEAGLEVGLCPYLLLLSEEERLDVYIYIPFEVREREGSLLVLGFVGKGIM